MWVPLQSGPWNTDLDVSGFLSFFFSFFKSRPKEAHEEAEMWERRQGKVSRESINQWVPAWATGGLFLLGMLWEAG